MDAAEHDVLAYMGFPAAHRAKQHAALMVAHLHCAGGGLGMVCGVVVWGSGGGGGGGRTETFH